MDLDPDSCPNPAATGSGAILYLHPDTSPLLAVEVAESVSPPRQWIRIPRGEFFNFSKEFRRKKSRQRRLPEERAEFDADPGKLTWTSAVEVKGTDWHVTRPPRACVHANFKGRLNPRRCPGD